MGFEKLGKLIKISDQTSASFKKSAEAAWICEVFLSELRLKSSEIEQEVKEVSFRDGQIKVRVCSASAASELKQLENSLILLVNKKLNSNLLKRIIYKII